MRSLLAALEMYDEPIDDDEDFLEEITYDADDDFLEAQDVFKKKSEDDDDDDEIDKLDAGYLSIMECAKELEEHANSIADMDEILDDADASIERLGHLRDVILAYGICRSTMEAVDPKCELVAKGICCSYEHLSGFPVRDENAMSAITGIQSLLAKIDGRSEQLRKIIDRRSSDLQKHFQKMTKNFTILLGQSYDKLRSIDTDVEKFSSTEVRAISMETFNTIIAEASEMNVSSIPVLERETVGNLGWDVSGIFEGIVELRKLCYSDEKPVNSLTAKSLEVVYSSLYDVAKAAILAKDTTGEYKGSTEGILGNLKEKIKAKIKAGDAEAKAAYYKEQEEKAEAAIKEQKEKEKADKKSAEKEDKE